MTQAETIRDDGGQVKRGWGYLRNSPKWHYFDAATGHSICGRWMRLGSMNDLEDGNDGSSDNCKACQKKVKALRDYDKTEARK